MRRARLAVAAVAALVVEVASAGDGSALFLQHCAACHERGPEHPGTARLADRWPKEASLLDRTSTNLSPELVRAVVRRGLNLMPPFRPGELSDADLDTLAQYLAAGPHPENEAGATK